MKKPLKSKKRAAREAARTTKKSKGTKAPRELSAEEIGKGRVKKKLKQPKPEKGGDLDVKEQEFNAVDARALVYSRRVDKIDKDLGLSTSLNRQPRMSTGLLAFDQLLGSGYVPGFNVVFGAEASAKSTACMTTLGSSIRMPIPVRKYFDAEGAIDRRYTGNILRSDSFDSIFGSRSRSGEWIKPPLCRYHDTNIIQEVFRDVHRIAKFMPDKVFRPEVGDNGEWFLVFERTKEQVALLKDLKLTPSKSLYQKTGKYWCSVGDDDSPQAAVFIDSLPSLIPQEIDEESMSDKARAIEARYLSQYMKLVRGDLRPKAIVLLAVNQLRANPNPQPGSMDWYEPGGNAIKFACMVGSTRIITSNGMVRAEDYARNVTGSILTTDGMQKPKGFAYMGDKPIVEVRLDSGHLIRCSEDHALKTFYNGFRKTTKGEEFVKARNLGKSHFVKTLIGQDVWAKDRVQIRPPVPGSYSLDNRTVDTVIPDEVTPELARWMGLMTGDGSYCGRMFTYTSIKRECRQFRELTEQLFGVRLKFGKRRGCWTTVNNIWSINQTLRTLGMVQPGHKKRVPEAIFRSPRDVVLAYLAGLFTADGHFGKLASLSTCSGQLAHDVQLLLNNLGFEALLSKNRAKSGFGKSVLRWHYRVWLTKDAVGKFLQAVYLPAYKLTRVPRATDKIGWSRVGFPNLLSNKAFSKKVREYLQELRCDSKGLNPHAILRRRDAAYSWASTLRTSHEREAVIRDLDVIYGLVDDYLKGYRYYPVKHVELNHVTEATFDGSMPTEPTIIANGIVCHNSDTRTMFTSRVPMDNFPRFKDNKGLCEEPSLEYPGGTDLYAFKGMTNYKNKYGTPGRKSAGRVLIKDGNGAARGFDTVYDTFKFLDICGVVHGPIHDSRRRFKIDLKPVRDVEWTWPMFKACILANDGGNRAVRAKAQELGAPKFDLRKFCKKMIETGRSEELMIKAGIRAREKASTVDLEADDGDIEE